VNLQGREGHCGLAVIFDFVRRLGSCEALFVRCAVLLIAVATPVLAQERWDHRGSVGLLTGFGYENRLSITQGGNDTGHRLFPELGGTLAISQTWSATLRSRLTVLGSSVGLSFLGGFRSSFGERFKTFVDLDLAFHALPIVTVGPHVGFGVQYELTSVIGAFAAAGVQFGFSPVGIRLGLEAMIGLQFRSYLLE